MFFKFFFFSAKVCPFDCSSGLAEYSTSCHRMSKWALFCSCYWMTMLEHALAYQWRLPNVFHPAYLSCALQQQTQLTLFIPAVWMVLAVMGVLCFCSISVRHARACTGHFSHTSVALCSPENAPGACHSTVWRGGSWAECGSLASHSLVSKSLLNQIWGHEEEIYSLSYQCDRMFLVKKRENGPLWTILRGFIV